MWEEKGIIIECPKIMPGEEGSIDLVWQTIDYILLIRVPEGREDKALFFSEDTAKMKIHCEFDPKSPEEEIYILIYRALYG
ncbi:hypothetical protein ES703_07818 [subsurface metagenome]